MNAQQIDQKQTKQVIIDAELHRRLKIVAADQRTTIRALLEGCLVELLTPRTNKGSK